MNIPANIPPNIPANTARLGHCRRHSAAPQSLPQ
jgi:hypothetical protein